MSRIADDLSVGIEGAFRHAIEHGRQSGEFDRDSVADTTAAQLAASVIGLGVLVMPRGTEKLHAVIDGITNGP